MRTRDPVTQLRPTSPYQKYINIYVSRSVYRQQEPYSLFQNLAYSLVAHDQGWLLLTKIYKYIACEVITNNTNHKITNHALLPVNNSSTLYSTVWGMVAAFLPGSVVFSLLTRWNGVSRLSIIKKMLNLQNKSLITVNNNNDNKK
jgi:hypothetical protein